MTTPKSLMTRNLVTVSPEMPVSEAYRLMYFKEIRHIPVFDEDQKLVGILSEKDIHRAMHMIKTSATEQTIRFNDEDRVSDYMSWPVFSVKETDSLTRTLEELIARKKSCFMVTDARGEYAGIVTTEDLLKSYLDHLKKNLEMKEKALTYFLPNVLY